VTNLALSPPTVFAAPLNLSSLHKLSQTFKRIEAQIDMEGSDEGPKTKPAGTAGHNSPASVDDPDQRATANNSANNCSDMPKSGYAMATGGEK